jgi:hypothetical protein
VGDNDCYEVLFSEMKHASEGGAVTFNLSQLVEVQFLTHGPFDVWIDDVAFVPQ